MRPLPGASGGLGSTFAPSVRCVVSGTGAGPALANVAAFGSACGAATAGNAGAAAGGAAAGAGAVSWPGETNPSFDGASLSRYHSKAKNAAVTRTTIERAVYTRLPCRPPSANGTG